MKARNKQTGKICEVFWQMCDMGRKCRASDKPIETAPCIMYNAVVDDYEFEIQGRWVDGLDYIKRWRHFYIYKGDRVKVVDESEYNKTVRKSLDITERAGIRGKTGLVLDKTYNPKMHWNEVLVVLDGDHYPIIIEEVYLENISY